MCCIQDSCDSWDIVEQQGRQGGRQVQEVHLQEGEGSTCGATQVNPAQPPIGQLASLSCALIGRHRCGVAQAAIPGLRALSLSGGKIGLAGQMSSFYLPSSQLPSSSSAGRSKLESANIQGRILGVVRMLEWGEERFIMHSGMSG